MNLCVHSQTVFCGFCCNSAWNGNVCDVEKRFTMKERKPAHKFLSRKKQDDIPTELELITEADGLYLMEQRPQACFLSGHRKIPQEDMIPLRDILDQEIEMLVYQGFHTFLCGMAKGFDLMAAAAILRLQKRQQDVQLINVIPCRFQTSGWSESERMLYRAIIAGGRNILLSETYTSGCMMKRNHFMVSHAVMGLLYCNPTVRSGGTHMTRMAASRQRLPMINLFTMLHPEVEEV